MNPASCFHVVVADSEVEEALPSRTVSDSQRPAVLHRLCRPCVSRDARQTASSSQRGEDRAKGGRLRASRSVAHQQAG